ncbi:hypothetical protein N6P31_01400 [Pectobacterium betavasculorum]|uniref:hypothetical protein n=1 Tax=Pectobacterium betavasculorum TaxID=55207 RepID=UPI00313B53E4
MLENGSVHVDNLKVSTNVTDLNSVGEEITALKFAVGLIFQKMQEPLRENFLLELRQLDLPPLNKLAEQLEQFKV